MIHLNGDSMDTYTNTLPT